MTSQRFEFPLPERALPRVRITPEQHEELRAFAVRTAEDVLRDGPTWGRTNVNAARERGWKVSQRSPEACFMMKTTTTSKPVKAVKSSTAAQHAFSAHTSSSVSSDDSSGGGSGTNGTTPGTSAQRGSGGAGGRAFMGSVRLAGYTLDDVVSAIHCETTKAQRQQLSKSYGNAYLDCCIMQTLEGAKQFDPFWYLGLKWTALKTPFEKIVNHREFVYLEHSGTHINAMGQRMLYRIIQSVSLDEFGGEKAYFGLTRAHLEAAYVYWMDGPSHVLPAPGPYDQGDDMDGVLTVCMKGLAHPKGKVPIFLIERLMKKFWKAGWTLHTASAGAGGSEQPVDKQKMTLDLATEWVADADRKACALCQKRFRFGRRMRHHCRACGEVICRSCTQYFLLTYASSIGSYPMHDQYSTANNGLVRKPNPFGDDDDDDLPATLGGEGPSGRRGRMRVASENDAVMVGKVCRRCVEMKKVSLRRETSRSSSMKQPTRTSTRMSSRRTRINSWDKGVGGGHMPVSIEEADEHDEDHHDFPIMGHEDEDGDFFIPETPLPSHTQPQYHSQFHHHNQPHNHHGADDHDDTTSEFSIGDFDQSQNTTFKPFATLDLHGAHEEDSTRGHRAHPDAGKMSIDSSFSQSGFSVGIHTHDEDSDNDDEFVDYHSETEQELASVRHPQLGQLTHLTVQEEERFTMPKAPVAQPPPPPPPVAQQFALTAAALSAPRYTQDARLRIEDLLADTDDEEEDYSTSPPLRPTALDVQDVRPTPQLVRTASAPPLHTHTVKRAAPPSLPLHQQPYMPSNNRESNMSSISFSSFDADYLIDASALDEDEDDEFMRHSTTIDGDESESEEVLLARIQKIQDEVLRRQLLSSSASSVASSLSASTGPAIRFNRPTRTPSNVAPPAVSNGTSLSESSTISSNESFLSAPSSLPDATATPSNANPAAGAPRSAKKVQKAMQKQVESSIADQAQLLYEIQKERNRGAFTGYPNTSITSPWTASRSSSNRNCE